MKTSDSSYFHSSSACFGALPEDSGAEIAFVGRSNSGKSTVLNTLMNRKSLAKTSSEPGKTRLVNLFALNKKGDRRLADLPGYGYAKVGWQEKKRWNKELSLYLQRRISLKGVVIVMDSRHPMTDLDRMMISLFLGGAMPFHVLLNKSDKLSKNQRKAMIGKVEKELKALSPDIGLSSFSSLNREGIGELWKVLNRWLVKGEKGEGCLYNSPFYS